MATSSAKHVQLLLVWGFLLASIAGVASFFLPRQYSAVSQVLIISRDQAGVDPYTQAKAAERVGENLAGVMGTTDFFSKVIQSPDVISFMNNSPLWKQESDDRSRRIKWGDDVKGRMIYGTSIMQITVYAETRESAVVLSNAVTKTVVSQGWEYVGGDVTIKAVNNPLVSRFPSRPNLPLNMGVGFLAGMFVYTLWRLRYRA